MDSFPHIAWLSSPEGELEYLNEEWERYTGIAVKESGEDALARVVHPDDLVAALQAREHAQANEEALELRYRLRRRDGAYRWHLARTKLVRAKQGHVLKRIGTATDIHELVLSEETLAFALNSAKMGTWEVDLQTDEVTASPGMLELWNVGANEYQRKRDVLQSKVHPADIEVMRATMDLAIQTGQVFDLEYRIRPSPGEERWIRSRGRCTYGSGADRPTKFSGVVFDVTSQRRAQEADRAALETLDQLFSVSPSFMALLSVPDYRILKSNAEHSRLFRKGELIGKPLLEVEPGFEEQGIVEILNQVISSKRPYVAQEMAVRFHGSSEGEPRVEILDVVYQPLRHPGVREVYVIAVQGNVITEQIRVREELRQAVLARDTFMSMASHELKTPLTSLDLQVQARQRAYERGNLQKFAIDRIPVLINEDARQIKRLIRLVDDMLDISRLRTGKLALVGEEFDLCEMARESITRLASQIDAQGCTVTLDAPDPIQGCWDRFRIEQVFVNLLTNALKYGVNKPVEISIREAGSRAVLSVRDHGIGIEPKDQERIFGQFERAVSESAVSGLGLGLYIAQKIIEGHGGTIRVESEMGRGSTFIVEFPRRAIPQGQERVL